VNWVERHLGGIMIAIGLIHLTIGIVRGSRIWADMWDDGLFSTIGANHERGEILWFCATGLLIICAGLLMRAQIRATGTLPLSFGIVMLVPSVAIAVALPASGVWAVMAVALVAIRMATRVIQPATFAHGADD